MPKLRGAKFWLFVQAAMVYLVVCGCQMQNTMPAPTATASAISESTATPIPTLIPSRTPSSTPTPQIQQPGVNQETLTVPQGAAPTIDGVLDTGEWDASRKVLAADGSEVLFLQTSEILYVGIRGSTPEMIVGNIFIHEGETIRNFHASAALGTATFEQKDDGWELIQPFVWRCRSTSDSETARAERDTFFSDEGWVATNSRIGTPNMLEFKIIPPQGPFTLAVNILRSSDPDVKVAYPVNLTDGVIIPTPGGYPQMMQFKPEQWVRVSLTEPMQ